ncbi:TPA: ead/Ea22-like family protein [Escherichia coli]|nr:ead/Ea22-like family protein [Escherichia coli]HBC1316059.1 ead/Ea22-like family protein [Escherichia coli]
MSNIDKRALREAAEKATKGQWAVEFDDEIYSTDGVNHEQIAMVFSENEASDAAFIAAANPVTVLALLDELEGKEKQRAAANKVVVQQDIELQELRLRIAELEAREVVLPRAHDVHPLGPQSAKIFCEFHRSIVNRCADEIRKVGVKVSIKGN